MELIRISSDKIKISLTKDELEAYDLSFENIDYGQKEAREAFKEIFIAAREKTGFETDEEKVFVQIFRAKNGGCEIFVSKIEGKGIEKTIPAKEFFVFEGIDELISACRILKRVGFENNSSAYTDGKNFFIMLTLPDETAVSLVCEHGEREFLPHQAYIKEHMKAIRENDAVDILSQY